MANKRKGLLFVINDFNVGGAEVFILRLGKSLSDYYNIYITEVQPQNNNQEFYGRFTKAGFKHIPARHSFNKFFDYFFWKLNAFFSLLGYNKIYKSIKSRTEKKYWKKTINKYNISIVNSHLLTSDLFVLNYLIEFKKSVDFKWVVTLHSSYNSSHFINLSKNEQDNFIERAYSIFKIADASVCVANLNKEIFNYFEDVKPPNKIYLGYDPNETNENESDDFSYLKKFYTFSMVARGIKEKGWEIAIEAFVECLKRYPDIRLVLVCPETDYILQLKKKYSSIKEIIFTGFLKSPVSVLKSSKVGILPSYYVESLPYTIIECIGNNLPVITSDRGELNEMIRSEEYYSGILLKNNKGGKPCVKHLEESMLKMIEDEQYYMKLKANSSFVFSKFSIDNCINQYINLFNNL